MLESENAISTMTFDQLSQGIHNDIRDTNSNENYPIEADYQVFAKKGLQRHIYIFYFHI